VLYCYPMKMRSIVVAGLLLLISTQAIATEPFQVTFGTRKPNINIAYGVSDSGSLIIEADNGDLVVAGYGGSVFTDTGNREHPMLVRIKRDGKIDWTRIYDELENYKVLSLIENDGNHFLLFKQRVRNRSGRTGQVTDRVSLWQAGPLGHLKREIASIENLVLQSVTAYEVDDDIGFLIVASEVSDMAAGVFKKSDVTLFELSIDGKSRQLPFPKGVKGSKQLVLGPYGIRVFLQTPTSSLSQATEIVFADAEGELRREIPMRQYEVTPNKLLVANDRIYLYGHRLRDERSVPVLSFSFDGELLWRIDINGVDRSSSAVLMNDGGLVITGVYAELPIAARISVNGQVVWKQRFGSAKKNARTIGITVLKDGWLAISGLTLPGKVNSRWGDPDAFLVVTDPDAHGLAMFSGCTADAVKIEKLREELKTRTGIEVRREPYSSAPALQPLGKKLSPNIDCGSLSEHHLLAFLREAVNEVKSLGLQKPSDRAVVRIELHPKYNVDEIAYRDGGRVPLIEVEHQLARDSIRFIGREIFPYTERMLVVSDALNTSIGMHVGWTGFLRVGGRVPPFSEKTIVTENFLELFEQLPADRQRDVRRRLDGRPFHVAGDPDFLHLWADKWIFVGRNKITEVFTYLLETLPDLESQIEKEVWALNNGLGLRIGRKTDATMLHTEYLATLRDIAASAKRLSPRQRELIYGTKASIRIGSRMTKVVGVSGYRRQVYMRPAGADQILAFIAANAEDLRSQEYLD